MIRAVIPAAGKGTRMMSVTGGEPKELLPLGVRTILDHILDIANSVCDETVVVWDSAKGDLPSAVTWVPQMPISGLAPAIASGLATDYDNLVLLPDAIFLPEDPAGELLKQPGDIVVAVAQVSELEVNRYGICELDSDGFVTKMIEKPNPDQTESRWAISGRYLFRERAASALIQSLSDSFGSEKEIDLSTFFNHAIATGLDISVVKIPSETKRFDSGDPDGYRHLLMEFC